MTHCGLTFALISFDIALYARCSKARGAFSFGSTQQEQVLHRAASLCLRRLWLIGCIPCIILRGMDSIQLFLFRHCELRSGLRRKESEKSTAEQRLSGSNARLQAETLLQDHRFVQADRLGRSGAEGTGSGLRGPGRELGAWIEAG